MSVLDTVTGAVQQHPELNEEQHSNLLRTAIDMFGNRAGLSGLINNAQSHELVQVVKSWIGRGENQPITPQKLQELIGEDRVHQLASRVGVTPEVASAALTRVLPVLVDQLTPQGKLPQAA